jgi:hypothetical protein
MYDVKADLEELLAGFKGEVEGVPRILAQLLSDEQQFPGVSVA